MKKSKLLVLSLLAVSAMSLTSCGEAGPKGDTGDKGEQGEKGDTGTPGKDGTNGVDGKSFLNGEGVPSDTLGNDGDSYVDTTTFDYYAKENGKWVKKGNIKGEKGDTGDKGDAGEKGEKGDTGSKGDKGDTGSTGSQGSKGDTAWTNTILPFDYGYITTSTGSAKVGETVTFKVTITDDSCKAFNVLFDDDEVEAVKIDRTSSTSNEFEIEKEMKTNGYVVRAVGYENIDEAFKDANNISLAKDITSDDLWSVATTASFFDGSIEAFSDLTTFGSDGELTVSSSVNLNLNGFNINLGSNKLVVSSGASLGLSNSVKNDSSAGETKGVISSSSEGSAVEINGGTSEQSKTSLSVGSDVSITATNGAAIKQSGADSSVTIDGGSVTGTTSAIEVNGGSLAINGGTVSGTGATNDNGKSGSAIVINKSDSSDISVDIAGGTVSSTNSYVVYQDNTGSTGTKTVEITYNSGEISGSKGTANSDATIKIEIKSDNDFSYNEVTKTYTINSKQGLIDFRNAVNAGETFKDKTIKLAKDIDLSSETNWTPIGNGKRTGATYVEGSKIFEGIFDGGNHTIDNFKINFTQKTDKDALGLFGVVSGGSVKNIKFTNVKIIDAGSNNCGTAVGLLVGNGTVDNVIVESGSVSGKEGTGGIVGRMTIEGTISNCINKATISGSSKNIGGIVGAAYYTRKDKEMKITNCHNKGEINGNYGTGGIAGLCSAHVSGCTNSAAITGSNVDIGGIVGEQKSFGSIKGCTNTGSVTSTAVSGSYYGTGGIVGWVRYGEFTTNYQNYGIIDVSNNNNSGDITGSNDAGGIIGCVYNAISCTGNTNEAEKIQSTNFAAGIVGSVQLLETSPCTSPKNVDVTITGNTSKTVKENITGKCVTEIVWFNPNGTLPNYSSGDIVKIEGNTPNTDGISASVKTAAELKTALEDNNIKYIKFTDDINYSEQLIISNKSSLILDLNGKTFTYTSEENINIISTKLTIKGNGTVNATNIHEKGAIFWLEGSTLNIFDGNYNTDHARNYGICATKDSFVNLGTEGSSVGPNFKTTGSCLSVNGEAKNTEATYNVYGGTYTATRNDGSTHDMNVIQISNENGNTEKYTLNIYGGTFEQTGKCTTSADTSNIIGLRYTGAKEINIYGGTYYCNGDLVSRYNDNTVINDKNNYLKKSVKTGQ